MDDQREDHSSPKRPPQRNCPNQLYTHNVPTDDMENTNGTNYGEDLLLIEKPQNLPQRTERMLQGNQNHRGPTIYRATHPQRK